MIEVQSQQGVLLAIISLACLGCIYALCLCCGKKSSMRQEDNDLYDQDDFDQDSKYAESRKHTTVLRPSQIETPSTSRGSLTNRHVNSDIQWRYQNLTDVENGILEPTYVDPIPNSLYANTDDTAAEQKEATNHKTKKVFMDTDTNLNTGTYENVFPTAKVRHDSDSCNYENWDKNRYEDDSDTPDYVNEITQ